MDTFFLGDDERNYCNIIGFIRLERFKAEEVKNQLFDKTTQFTRNRSKLVKFLGTWWFKEVPMPEMVKQKDKLIQLRTGIHDEKQLADFMAKEQSIRDPIDNVQWRAFLIEDYTPTESVFIYKCHHVLADGIALMLNLANITDNPDPATFPFMALRFSLWQRVVIHLLVPVMILIISIQQFVCWRKERNGIKNDRVEANLNALKNIAFCHDIPLDVVKARCVELGVTINEFIFGIISQTMKRCMEFHNDTTTRSIRVAVPFSLRPPPTHATDFQLRNDFAILPVEMRLIDDLKTEIK